MRTPRSAAVLLVPLLLAPFPAAAAPAPGPATVDEIEACLEGNFPESSSVQVIEMRKHDRIGAVTRMRAQIFWKKDEDEHSRVMMRFSDPPDLRDASLLMIEEEERNDMWMYLPELRRVRRVTGRMMSGSMFGTDFSYEEFQRLQGIEQADMVTRRVEDAEVAGRPAWVLETVPSPDVSEDERPANERMLLYVDQERCVPLQIEFFKRAEPDEEPRKRVVVDPARVEKNGERHVPRHMEAHDLRDGTRTELEVESIELEARIRDSVFTMQALEDRAGRGF